MSDYTKATNFASKDSLPSGNSGKIIKGTEIDTEFNAIASAISSKADTNSPTFTGTPLAPTATSSTNTTQIATTAFVQTAKTAILEAIYPVGSIYTNATNATNPGTLLGFGTWTAFASGRMMVGYNASDTLFDTAEETGGSKDAIAVSHTHTFSATTDSQGTHTHTYQTGYNTSVSSTGSNGNFGGGTPDDTSYIYNTSSAGAHTHSVSGTTGSTGSSGTNANLPPYITVYMWKRTA